MFVLKIFKKLFLSMESAFALFLIFATACGVATFIENDYGTETAWGLVYGTLWFGGIQLLLGINLAYNIFRYKLYRKEKLPIFIFHVGFLFILLGSIVTRYIGYEGIMHIRNGQTQNKMISSEPYIQIEAKKGNKIYHLEKKAYLSKIGDNDFDIKMDIDGKTAEIKYVEFVPNATTSIVEDPNGKPMISFMSTDADNSNFVLKDGMATKISDIVFTLNNPNVRTSGEPMVEITTKDGKFYISSNRDIGVLDMKTQERKTLKTGKKYEFIGKRLYSVEGLNFAPKSMKVKGKEKLVSGASTKEGMRFNAFHALRVKVKYNGDTKEVTMFGQGKGAKGFVKKAIIGGVPFSFEWGSKFIVLPFSLKLRKFELKRYPGSMSPSSYASEVTVIDKKAGVNMPFRIYMNHVLDYKNYRFFQSSYDKDERGTILSVNHDPGKYPTYFGYILMGIGFILTIFAPKSRFRILARRIQKEVQNNQKSVAKGVSALFILLLMGHYQNALAQESADALKSDIRQAHKYSKSHADRFGALLVQDRGGRIKPIDSLANDILNKVARTRSMYDLDSDQIFLGMIASPRLWQRIPIVKVSHDKLKKILGLPKGAKYASFEDFFTQDPKHPYKLADYAERANRKPPIDRDKFDKDVLKVDERINVLYYVYTGDYLKIFPKIGDPNNKWYDPKSAISTFPKKESEHIRSMLTAYFDGLNKGVESGDWSDANSALKTISEYQKKYGAAVVQDNTHIKAEILYNKLNIFPRLILVYILGGFLLLFVILYRMLNPKTSVDKVIKVFYYLFLVTFMLQTFGMGLRWYVSGHAPWSDGYESMLYISWSMILAGLIFSRQSVMSLALTAILTGVFLFVAHLSWMDPEITNLVPVLKSYWLMVHVSVITASYGFLGLNALLGYFTLIMFIMLDNNPKNKKNEHILKGITEATRVNEMSMILGLMLLTLGNFLGGVWANESWGKYWSWDPKETWALVSILVYAAVVHQRLIPKLNGQFAFAVASTIAYASVIMTYLGVNYYLSGMHSYAAGEPIPIPAWIYWVVAVVIFTILLAIPKRKYSRRL
ncbi:MAG: cytochrome c biogenesis protein CcsA [Epsilonproteobacteria bacterium]|nr:cytochrome c biogenesis protein CcsA [Campylobacterota bacterium]